MTTITTSRLFNPASYEGAELDPASARLMRALAPEELDEVRIPVV